MSMLLQVQGLSAGYPNHTVLRGVSLQLERGEWCALLGPNGCGKTTFLNCVVGKTRPREGRISLDGHDLQTAPAAAKRALGYACPPEQLPALLTARQCLEVVAAARELTAVEPELMVLAEQLNFLPYLERFVDTFSLGTRQKLAVLTALIGTPPLIVLDEAFNGLDATSALALKRYLQAKVRTRQVSVLLATHALDLVERYATRAVLMGEGQLIRAWDRTQIEAAAQGFEVELANAVPHR